MHLAPELGRLLQVDGQGVEHDGQRAGELAGADHGHVEAVEDVRVPPEGLGEARARGDGVAHVLEHGLELLVRGLGGERGEDADEVQAAAEHGGELPGEQHQGGEVDAARERA